MKQVIVIDDAQEDCYFIERAIRRAAFEGEIRFAHSGEDGLRLAQEECPDVVIVGTKLPGMDGFETCKAIKDACGGGVKVIVITGVIDVVDAGKARQMGADEYCVKTSDLQPLVEIFAGFVKT